MRAKQTNIFLAAGLLAVLLTPGLCLAQAGEAQGGLRLRLPGDVSIVRVDATVQTADGRSLRASAMGDTVTLPAGAYKVSELTFVTRFERKEWSFSFSAGYGQVSQDAVPIKADTATVIKPKVSLGVEGGGSGRSYTIQLAAIGPLGLKLSNATVDEKRPPAAAFTLVAPDGAIADSGEFEFG